MKAQRDSKIHLYSVFNLGARLGWVVSATLWPLYSREGDPVSTLQDTGCVPGPVWTGAENVALTEIRSLDRPHVRNEIVHQVGIYHLRKSVVVELTDLK